MTCNFPTSSTAIARLAQSVACGLLLAFAAKTSHGATISWSAASTITNDSDVSTIGSLDRAYNFGDVAQGTPSTTINGVLFSPFAVQSTVSNTANVGNTTISEVSGTGTIYASSVNVFTDFNTSLTPVAALSTAYKTLLGSSAYTVQFSQANGFSGGGDLTVLFNGLTVGDKYLLQLFVNDSRQNYSARSESVNDGNGNSVILAFNTGPSGNDEGGVGQFATGSFTADAASASIILHGLTANPNFTYGVPQINGLQLRNITGTPEPTSLTLLALGGLTLLQHRRQRY